MTIKRHQIIVKIEKVGKMFEITRTTTTKTVITFARNRKAAEDKIQLLLKPIAEIRDILSMDL